MVENQRAIITMTKSIATGCATLEIAKLVMYEFYYYCLLPKFGDRLRLCFTDTDSFTCHITSVDLHGELAAISDWLDTSNFAEDHPLYSSANLRTLGKFKSETGDVPPTEFCGLRSKMYSLATLTGAKSFRKAKGVPKTYVKKRVKHEQYLHVLNHWNKTKCKFRAFRSKNRRVTTRKMWKVCLSYIDVKR